MLAQSVIEFSCGEEIYHRADRVENDLTNQSSKPTNLTASSTLLRFDTTALAGKSASGQPIATQIMMT